MVVVGGAAGPQTSPVVGSTPPDNEASRVGFVRRPGRCRALHLSRGLIGQLVVGVVVVATAVLLDVSLTF